MRTRAGSRGVRIDLVALVVVSAAVLGLVVVLLMQTQRANQAASAAEYPQLSQPPHTAAVPTVAFVGDSYSAGTGSSGYNSRFTTLVAAYEGWSSASFAYGGTGYLRDATTSARTGCGEDRCPSYDEVVNAVKSYNPSIVVVSGGRNDVGLAQHSVDAAINRFFDDLHAAVPRARIVVTSPVWAYSSPPAQLAQIQQSVRAAAERVGATYLDIKEPLVENRSLVSDDRVHPNDQGHAKLAQAIEVALSRALTTPPATSTPTP